MGLQRVRHDQAQHSSVHKEEKLHELCKYQKKKKTKPFYGHNIPEHEQIQLKIFRMNSNISKQSIFSPFSPHPNF